MGPKNATSSRHHDLISAEVLVFLSIFLSLAIAGTPQASCHVAHVTRGNSFNPEQDRFLRELVTPMMTVSKELVTSTSMYQLPFTKVQIENRRIIFPQRLGEKQIVVQWSKELQEPPPAWIEVGSNFVFVHLQPHALNEMDLTILAQAFYGSSFFPLIESLDPRVSSVKYQELKPGRIYTRSTPKDLNDGPWTEFEIWKSGMTKYEREVTELIQYARVYGKLPRDPQNNTRLWKHDKNSYLIDALKREDEKTQAAFLAPPPSQEKAEPKNTEPTTAEIQPQLKPPVLRKSHGEKAGEMIAAFIRAQGRKPSTQIEKQQYSLMNTHKRNSDFLQALKKDPEVWLIYSTETRGGLSMEGLANALTVYIKIHATTPSPTGDRAEAHLHKIMFSHRNYPTFIKHMMKEESVWKIYSEFIKREETKAAEFPQSVAKDITRFILKHLRKPIDQTGEADLYAAMIKHSENPDFIEEMQANPKAWRIYSVPAWGKLKAEEVIVFIKTNGHKPRSTSTGPEFQLYRAAIEFMNDPEFIKTMESEPKAYGIFKKRISEKPKSIVEEDAEMLIAFIDESGHLPNSRRIAERDLHKALKRHEKNPDFLKLLRRHPTVWKVITGVAATELSAFIGDYKRAPDWRRKDEREIYETMKRFEKDPVFLESMQSRAKAWSGYSGRRRT